MKYAISNIAWNEQHDDAVISLMHKYSFSGVEIAPTEVWKQPLNASKEDVLSYRKYWKNNGIDIVAMQALLFGHPELTIFESEEQRKNTITYLKGIIDIANGFGAQVLVFGSPKNRITNGLAPELVADIATEFFYTLGDYAQQQDTCLCIEPNPIEYNCDFITDSKQAIKLVNQVNSPGFGLHLDIAALQMSHEDVNAVINQQANITKHIHISEPYLNSVGTSKTNHAQIGEGIKASSYNKNLSIEMRAAEEDKILEAIESALKIVQKNYQ